MKKLPRGKGGETHQKAKGEQLTTAQGAPVSDDQNWLKAGERGPSLMEDQVAREPVPDLPPSDALSILKNGPASFAGRRLGLYVSDGADADIIAAIRFAAEAEGAKVADAGDARAFIEKCRAMRFWDRETDYLP